MKLNDILSSRLALQSIKNYLDENHLPADPVFLQSKEFYNEHFSKWPAYHRKHFLIKIVGPFYWKTMQEILEK